MKTKIDRVIQVKESYSIVYCSGYIRTFEHGEKLSNTIKQYIKNSYVYILENGIRLYKLNHD